MDCLVRPDGVIACMCPREGTLPGPAVETLDGQASAYTCGCTDDAGLVCIPEP